MSPQDQGGCRRALNYTLPAHGIRFTWCQARWAHVEARARGGISFSLISSDPPRDHVSACGLTSLDGYRIHDRESRPTMRHGGGGCTSAVSPLRSLLLNFQLEGNLTSSDVLEIVLSLAPVPASPRPQPLLFSLSGSMVSWMPLPLT